MAREVYRNSIIESGPQAGTTQLGPDYNSGEEEMAVDAVISVAYT